MINFDPQPSEDLLGADVDTSRLRFLRLGNNDGQNTILQARLYIVLVNTRREAE